MDNIIFAILGLLILFPFSKYVSPRRSNKAKLILLGTSFLISLLTIASTTTLTWWMVPFVLLIFSSLMTVLLGRILYSEQVESDGFTEKTEDLYPRNKLNPVNEITDDEQEELDSFNKSQSETGSSEDQLTDIVDNVEDVSVKTQEIEEEKNFFQSQVQAPQVTLEQNNDKKESYKKEKVSNEDLKLQELSPEEELLAARQQNNETFKQDSNLDIGTSPSYEMNEKDNFVIDEFKKEDLEQQDLKKHFEEREGFENFDVDVIEEEDIPSRSSDVFIEDRSEFTDLEDLLNQRNDDHDQKDS